LTRMPPGCGFEPRCRFARERCHREPPPLATVAASHESRCFFWQEQEAARLDAVEAPTATSQSEATIASTVSRKQLLSVAGLAKDYVDSNRLFGVVGRKTVVHAIDDVSLTLAPNETLAIVGESGCGKTTLARCIVGLAVPTRGTIVFDGSEAS